MSQKYDIGISSKTGFGDGAKAGMDNCGGAADVDRRAAR
jgi:hypothetical protein